MTEYSERVDAALRDALDGLRRADAPPQLTAAVEHAVLGGGKRLRGQLVLAVAEACSESPVAGIDALAATVELLHCASLVHDDLPCFDDAPTRRGLPSVHARFGEALAVLVGDGLIALAFETVARNLDRPSTVVARVTATLAAAIGPAEGLVAGQAWESEPRADIGRYHRAKTGALFEAALGCAALAGGAAPEPWRAVGGALGEAYQLADDLWDAVGDAADLGKPTRQDARHGRTNAGHALGLEAAFERLKQRFSRALSIVPGCPGQDGFRTWAAMVAAGLYVAHGGPDLARVIRRRAIAPPAEPPVS